MALNNNNFTEILRYTRGLLRSQGLADLDERIVSHLSAETAEPLGDLVRYLKSVAEYAKVGSNLEYGRTLHRLREFVKTEDGRPISGIDLEMTNADAERFGTRIVNLEGAPVERDDVFSEIINIVDVIYEDLHRNDDTGE